MKLIREFVKTVLSKFIFVVLGFGFILIGLSSVVHKVKLTPNYAAVLLDDERKLYHSPMHFMKNGGADFPQGLRVVTYGDVVFSDYKPDESCRDYFEPETQTELSVWLEEYGLISKPQPRWNVDGTWNW